MQKVNPNRKPHSFALTLSPTLTPQYIYVYKIILLYTLHTKHTTVHQWWPITALCMLAYSNSREPKRRSPWCQLSPSGAQLAQRVGSLLSTIVIWYQLEVSYVKKLTEQLCSICSDDILLELFLKSLRELEQQEALLFGITISIYHRFNN